MVGTEAGSRVPSGGARVIWNRERSTGILSEIRLPGVIGETVTATPVVPSQV